MSGPGRRPENKRGAGGSRGLFAHTGGLGAARAGTRSCPRQSPKTDPTRSARRCAVCPRGRVGGGLPRSVAVGDFNGDTDPDLAVANDSSDNVSILLGGAGGSFSGPTNFAA